MTQPTGSLPTQEQEDAYAVLVQMLREWNLEALAPDVLNLLQDGRSQDQISMLLQDTEAYKKRFAGNEARRKAGLAVLNPREYLEVESAYRQIMQSAGLPKGFYDSPDDFANFIGIDVSPQEIKSRVDMAVDSAERLDDGTKRAFQDFYGLQTGDLAAYFLGPERAMPQLQKVARGARIGGAGFNQGLQMDRERAERLALSDVTDVEIPSAVSRVSSLTQDIGKLGQMYGQRYDQTSAEQEVFFQDEQERRKRRDLASRERAEFAGSSGVGRGTLAESPGGY